MKLDQQRIGGTDGGGPHIVLLHLEQSLEFQSRDASLNKCFERQIAGLRQESRTQADRELLDARASLADVGKFSGEAGAGPRSPALVLATRPAAACA